MSINYFLISIIIYFLSRFPKVSNEIVSGIVNFALVVLGYATSEDHSRFIDPNKVARARAIVGKAVRKDRDRAVKTINSIYYDSVKSKCRVANEINDRVSSVMRKEDLYVMVSQPGDYFFANFTPRTAENDRRKKGKIVADTIKAKLIELGIDPDQILMLGVDSTYLNTGHTEGINNLLEILLGHKCYWTVCGLHFAELGVRALVIKLDGKSLSDNKFSGELGKLLGNVTDLPIDPTFKPWSEYELPEMPPEVEKQLNNDQKYLYKLVRVLITGIIPPGFDKYEIGVLSLARWLTFASRILRLAISDLSDLDLSLTARKNLQSIVKFILAVYVPYWFRLKASPSWLAAPDHFLFYLQQLQTLDKVTRKTVKKTVSHGAWGLHEETLLQKFLCSDNREERMFAVRMIKMIREKSGDPAIGDKSPRKRVTPKLNFQATSVMTLTPEVWEDPCHEPLLTCDIPTSKFTFFLITVC